MESASWDEITKTEPSQSVNRKTVCVRHNWSARLITENFEKEKPITLSLVQVRFSFERVINNSREKAFFWTA